MFSSHKKTGLLAAFLFVRRINAVNPRKNFCCNKKTAAKKIVVVTSIHFFLATRKYFLAPKNLLGGKSPESDSERRDPDASRDERPTTQCEVELLFITQQK